MLIVGQCPLLAPLGAAQGAPPSPLGRRTPVTLALALALTLTLTLTLALTLTLTLPLTR